jgi:hypothetical protein
MARVVRRSVDASPLILLGKIGRLDLLRVVGPGSGIMKSTPPSALLPPITAWSKLASRIDSLLQSKWPFRAPSAL